MISLARWVLQEKINNISPEEKMDRNIKKEFYKVLPRFIVSETVKMVNSLSEDQLKEHIYSVKTKKVIYRFDVLGLVDRLNKPSVFNEDKQNESKIGQPAMLLWLRNIWNFTKEYEEKLHKKEELLFKNGSYHYVTKFKTERLLRDAFSCIYASMHTSYLLLKDSEEFEFDRNQVVINLRIKYRFSDIDPKWIR
jgi:hypothetical protein